MMAHRPRQAWGLLVGIGLILYACTDAVLTPDDPADATLERVESSAASLSFGTGAGPTTFYCNVVTRQANGAFRHRTLRFVLPTRFSTPGLESELRFFERRYSDGTPVQKAVCDLPVHGFAFAMVQARLHDGNRNRSVQPFSPWQRSLLGREVASLLERGEIQTAGFLSNFLSWAMQTYFVTEDPDDIECDGDFKGVQPGQFEGDYDYEGYWYCDGTIVLDGVETQELEGAPDVYYVWPEGEEPEPPEEPECCSGSGDPGDPPDDECDPELDTCDPCDPTDEICESAFDLSCNDAERGGTVTCTITGSTDDITAVEWHFTGNGLTADNIGTEPTWSGTAVVGGTVTATVSYGTGIEEAMLSDGFSVTSRNWSWDPSSTVLPHDTWPFDGGKPLAMSDTLGLTCWTDDQGGPCQQAVAALQPWAPEENPTGCLGGNAHGFECDEVSGGPNDKLWYITNAFWSLNRRSGVHPEFSTSRAFSPLVSCQPGDGPGDWAAYHDQCRELDGSGFVAGLIAHENGHVSQADAAAATGDDPVAFVEALVRANEADLISAVIPTVSLLDQDIQTAGAVHPTGNFDPRNDTWSFWDGTSYAILRTFNEVF